MTSLVTVRRPGVVTFLAILHFVGSACWLAGVAISLFVRSHLAPGIDGSIFIAFAITFGLFGGLQIACGIGLWTLQPYGRILQLILAVPFFLGIPIGTTISILLFVYLNKPGIKVMFSGRHAGTLTPDERAAVAADGAMQGVAIALLVMLIINPLVIGLFTVPVVAAVAIPGLLRARMTGNEHAAADSLQAITMAQFAYATSCGNGGYASSYVALATPKAPGAEPFLSSDLTGSATPQKTGYSFAMGPTIDAKAGPKDCLGRPTMSAFYATAVPQSYGATGTRSFATTDLDGVWQVDGRQAPTEPFHAPAVRLR